MSKLSELLRSAYLSIGIHTAPRGTLLFAIDHGARKLYGRLLRGMLAPAPLKADLNRIDGLMAFHITGGVGDHFVAARYIRDFFNVVGKDFRFDIFSARPGIVKWVFGDCPQFNKCYHDYYAQEKIIRHYPLAIRLCSFSYVYEDSADWHYIAQHNSKLLDICQTTVKSQDKIARLIKEHPRLDGYMAQRAVLEGAPRNVVLNHMSGIPYGGDLLKLKTAPEAMAKFGLKGRTYVTVHCGFDADFRLRTGDIGLKSTKAYPHFDKVISLLRQKFPDLAFVQLGVKTSEPLLNADFNLLDKTSFEETAEIIRHSVFHLDNESGLVHLAACLGVKSCVVFGPTPVDYFGYGGNINIKPTFCGNCWWMTEEWMRDCPRGFAEARCMTEQKPEAVAAAAASYLITKLDTSGLTQDEVVAPRLAAAE